MLTISIPDHVCSFLAYFYQFRVYLPKKIILVSYSDQQRLSLTQLRKTAQDNVTGMKYPITHLRVIYLQKFFLFFQQFRYFLGLLCLIT